MVVVVRVQCCVTTERDGGSGLRCEIVGRGSASDVRSTRRFPDAAAVSAVAVVAAAVAVGVVVVGARAGAGFVVVISKYFHRFRSCCCGCCSNCLRSDGKEESSRKKPFKVFSALRVFVWCLFEIYSPVFFGVIFIEKYYCRLKPNVSLNFHISFWVVLNRFCFFSPG